jgi:hypothetical protein
MALPRRVMIAALVAGATLLIAACGGSSSGDKDYVDSVNDVTSQLQSDLSQITGGPSVNSPEQAADVFTNVADEVDAAAADLEDITPPDEVTDLHDKLVRDLKTLGADAKGAGDDIKAGGAAAAPGVLTRFVTEATRLEAEIKSTIDEINAKLGQ